MSEPLSSNPFEGLSPEQQALLELRLRRRRGSRPGPERIPRRAANAGAAPASFAQERLWFLDRLEPDRGAYQLGGAVRFRGRLSLRHLADALGDVVARHETLRTVFREVDGRLYLDVRSPAPVPVPVVDLASVPERLRRSTLRGANRQLVGAPFDLGAGPLIRMGVMRLAPDVHDVCFAIHHVVSDGWSLRLFVREMDVRYAARRSGKGTALPPLPIDYSDFAAWQRRAMSSERLTAHLEWWRSRLEGASAALPLPTDRPRETSARTAGGRRTPVRLSPGLTRSVRQAALRHGATPFMILMTAFAALLQRYSGQDDLSVGTPVSGRTRTETEGLIGLFVNTLVIRSDLSGEPTVATAIEWTREMVLGAFAHQELPFERLVQELQPERDRHGSPLFQVLLTLEGAGAGGGAAGPGSSDAELLEIAAGGAKFDLSLLLMDGGDRITGALEYDAGLFDLTTARRMVANLLTVLEGITGAGEARLAELPVMVPRERTQVLVEWNDTARVFAPEARLLHDLMAGPWGDTPDAVAVVSREETVSFGELDRRSSRQARHLRALGVAPGTLVGVAMERSVDLVVALVAVLRSGAAYVPLDPDLPESRFRYLVADAGAPVVVTHERLRTRLPMPAGVAVIGSGFAPAAGAAAPAGSSVPVDPEAPAYVIYTSGSTGRPKGAVNRHRAVVNRILWMQEAFGLTPADAVLQKTPYGFDVSVWELFWPLAVGASLVMAPPRAHRDPERVAELFRRHRITTTHFVPSMLEGFLEATGGAGCDTLARVICSGEALSGDLAGRFSTSGLEAELHNLYGPTEAAVDVSWWPCRAGERRPGVPIGRPISNLRLVVVDRSLHPVPLGARGELLIGGEGLARGYHRRPGLTAERFVPDGFGAAPGSRAYHTGDLVRLLPDGAIEFQGRLDHQVKLRGVRIELGEVEAALRRHPAVREAVVVLREERPGEPRLVAFLVVRGEAPPVQEIRRFLADRLPETMVPAAFVALDRLPQTSSGKVDRGALRAPVDEPRSAGAGTAPRSPVEDVLAALWCEVLGLEEVGIDDDFFSLGGHSLLGTRLLSRVRRALGADLEVRTLFEAPTVARLAVEVEARRRKGGQVLPPLGRAPREASAPLSLLQQRLWVLQAMDPASVAYNLTLGLSLRGPLHAGVLARALAEVLRRHEVLRTCFPVVEGQPVQEVAPPPAPRLPVVDLARLERTDEVVHALARDHAWRPFDLERGPLVRWLLVRTGRAHHALVQSMHHIVGDGWSNAILLRELSAFYAAIDRGEVAALPELPVQYRDFAAWQRQWLDGERLDEQLAYWKGYLGEDLPELRLPTDRPPSKVDLRPAARRAVSLAGGLAQAARALARDHHASMFMVLLAAFETLLGRYTGQPSFTVGSVIANRRQREVEDLIGFFTNTVVFRAELADDPTVSELLARAREATLAAHVHQDLPFDRLADELRPRRERERSPLFQVLFTFENLERSGGGLPGLEVTTLDLGSHSAKFDLVVQLEAAGGELRGTFEYRAGLFDATTVARMIRHFGVLLAAAAADPDRSVGELPLLTPAERHQLVAGWNDTETAVAGVAPLHCLFEASAAATPDRAAVVTPEGAWSYRELDVRANRLAHLLRELGAGPGSLVAVHLDRRPEMVSAVLGILKAGSAYVPVDPGLPRARVEWLLGSLGVGHIVTGSAQLPALAELDGPPSLKHVITVDDPEPGALTPEHRSLVTASELERRPGEAPLSRSTPDDLAYVIFTSGSTGRPKGVMVRHRPVVNLIRWVNRRLEIGPSDRVLWVTSLSFDLSVYDLFGLLAAGGTVRVAGDDEVRDPGRLVRCLYHEPITLWDSAPAALQQLVPFLPAADDEPPPAWLRRIFLSGDWIPLTLPPRMEQAFPRARTIAMGGATEATVWSNVFPVRKIDPYWVSIPYGRPIDNARYHVLDHRLEPLPVAVEGDLYIGGDCLFSGYAGDASVNARKNVPDPFGGRPGGRLYRTGDRARVRADGNLEFLGRLDHQVKIRGFRVELGEIEAALREHPRVSEAVVLVREDAPGDRRLVAYVVVAAAEEPPARALREHLRQRLPEYMVPAAYVCLHDLPVTANGKLDRAALPAPDGGRETGDRPLEAPRSRTEEVLVAVWARVLGVARVGIHESFFELGGDSILGIRVVTEARAAGLAIEPRHLFERQTVAELAEVAVAVNPVARGAAPAAGPAPLAPAQRWFLELDLPDAHHFNQALLLAPREPLHAGRLERALAAVVDHHDALRARFHRQTGGRWQQELRPSGAAARLARVDLAGLSAPDRRRALEVAAARVQASLDLEAGPLLRLVLFDGGADLERRLLLVIHHLVVDGVSWRILLDDLAAAYRQAAEGSIELPPRTTSFRDWAAALGALAAKGGFADERRHWREAARPTAPLLRDAVAAPGAMAQTGTHSVELGAEETALLLRQAPAVARVRVEEVLLAALAEAVAGWTGEQRLRVELEGHGRQALAEGQDLSRTVGWFTSLYPVVIDVGGAGGPRAALAAAKVALRGVPGGGLGYAALRDFTPDPEIAGAARPEILFNYLGQLDRAVSDDVPLTLAPESAGPSRSPRQPLLHRLEVDSSIAGGRLRVRWTYDGTALSRETVEAIAHEFLASLRALIHEATRPGPAVLTPVDFPLARLDQAAVDRIAAAAGDLEDVYALTPLQRGLLYHGLDPETAGIYQYQVQCLLRGDLDARAFEGAWRTVVERHPILRTALLWEGLDEPLQVVVRRPDFPLRCVDLSGLPAARARSALAALGEQDRRRLLPLERAPLLRLALVRMTDDAHAFLWTFHHLVLDGWSVAIVVDEVFRLYRAACAGEEPALEAARPYRDFIAWLGERDAAAAEEFWRQALAGFDTPTVIGGSRGPRRAARRDFTEVGAGLPEPVAAGLGRWSRRHRLTTASLLHGLWALLLARHSGDDDVVFGTVSAGRPPELPGSDRMVGLFINTVPARVTVTPEARAGAWLQEVQARQAGGREFEHVSLADVQRWSELPAGEPLFETLLVVENYPVAESVAGPGGRAGLAVESTELFDRTNYPVTLLVSPEGTFPQRLLYDAGRLDRVEALRLLRHFGALAANLLEGDDPRLQDLALLTRAERAQLLVEWNDPAPGHRPVEAVLGRVAAQVAAAPDAVAVVAADGTALSYAGLARAAARLARRLRAAGVGPEVPVGVVLERSPALPVALLGIWAAGGVYVPCDAAQPSRRTRASLEDAGARVVVAHPGAPGVPEGAAVVLPVEREPVGDRGPEAASPDPLFGDPEPEPQAAAYVIFTSGSTGRPKGVVVCHDSLARRLAWGQAMDPLAPGDAVLQGAAPAFDFSIWELLAPLAAGATLVLSPAHHARPEDLVALMAARRVTAAHFVPTLLQMLTAVDPGLAGCPDLRTLFAGGEALPADLANRFAASAEGRPPLRLFNQYGPTEGTIDATAWRCAGAEDPVPIGRPAGGARALVLDARLRPVPVAVAGELHLGGPALARGYAGRPGLTGERFVPDPYGGVPGARLYRTGDVARHRGDGAVEFLGRLDAQVKVRGYRIELGEVEAALRSHPEVSDAVVVVREDVPGEPRLTGYVTAAAGEGPVLTELRRHVAAWLPTYMVPVAIVVLDRIPTTASGKVARRLLPAPGDERLVPERDLVPPRTAAERRLAAIWRDVLRVDRIGVEDDFFELGGDSILSIQVASRARGFGLAVTPRQVFEHPTVRELAAVAGESGLEVRASAAETPGPVALTPVQLRYLAEDPPDPHHFNQSLLLRVEPRGGRLDRAVLARALAAAAAPHPALGLRFRRSRGEWVQELPEAPRPPAASAVDLGALAAPRRAEALASAAAGLQASLDLERGPLLRAVCFDLGPGEASRLLLVAHHLVVDGVSWRILLDDLETAFHHLEEGRSPAIPPEAASFPAWAEHLAAEAAGPVADGEREHWLAVAAAEVPELPADRREPPGGSATASVALGPDETRELLSGAWRAHRVSVEDLLLTSLAETVGGWTGSRRVRVELEGHGREGGPGWDLSRTVGWLTVVYPLLLELDGVDDPAAAVRAVKESLRAVPRKGLHFGLLRYLGADAELSRALSRARPDVSFNYLGRLDGALPESSRFSLAPESAGPERSPRQPRRRLLDVDAFVVEGRLRIRWHYTAGHLSPEVVERLVHEHADALRRLLAVGAAPGVHGHVPSEFPWAHLGRAALERVVAGREAEVEDLYPLSPLQEGFFFHAGESDGADPYVQQLGCRLRGPLDPDRLEAAWRRVLERHPALRSALVWEGLDRPLQVVFRDVPVELDREDWTDLPAEEATGRLAALAEEERAIPLRLDRAPLMRFRLIRLDSESHYFLWTHHHLVLDGWSVSLVIRELFTVYRSLGRGEDPALPPARPYRDYIGLLQARRRSEDEAEAFWRRTLAGFDRPTPVGIARSGASRGDLRTEWTRLPEPSVRKLLAWARRHRLTVASVVQGAWGLLLGRYAGHDDVVFGSVTSGRPAELEGVEEMVGMFINTLPLRVRIEHDAPCGRWLAEIQEWGAEARQHEHVPLVTAHGWSGVPRDRPLFESLLAIENYPVSAPPSEAREGGLDVEGADFHERTSYPLTLIVEPGATMTMGALYDTGRLDRTDGLRLLSHLRNLLEDLSSGAARRVGDLEPLARSERAQLLREWSETPGEAPAALPVHRLFARQVDVRPDAVAVVAGGESLSYGELARRAAGVAVRLRSLGVGVESPVAIVADRSPELVPGLLGILEAGGHYVPVDPDQPLARTARLLDDARPAAIVAGRRGVAGLPVNGVPVVSVAEAAGVGLPADGAPPPRVDPSHLVYRLFTSGSTGVPKGVAIPHRAVVRLVREASYAALGPAETFLQLAPVPFDASTLEIWAPLLNGGRLVVAEPGREGLERLGATVARERVTTLWLTAGLFHQVAEDRPEDLASLRQLLAGGDVVSASHVRKVLERAPGLRVINGYGPTENTTFTCCEGTETPSVADPLPIGRPIAGTSVHLVDPGGRPCPVAVPGELWTGGAGLARGYAGRPGFTAELFVPDPFSDRPGERLYRTGDLCRRLGDGRIVFMGRIDRQVKVRGFRVEPAEVEITLQALPAVRDAAVVPRPGPGGETALVACVVLADGAEPSPSALRAAAAERLPEAMVPSDWVFLDELPLTANGKLDRGRIAELAAAEPLSSASVRPASPTEELIAGIWSEVLEIASVSPHDDFFDLGGHSLLATRAVGRIQDLFGMPVPLRVLFDAPVLADLARWIDRAVAGEHRGAEPTLEPLPPGAEVPLSYAQQRLWFLEQLVPGRPTFNVAVAQRLRGPLHVAALDRALRELLRRHQVLRSRFPSRGGVPRPTVDPVPSILLRMLDLRSLPEDEREREVRRVAAAEALRPFDLGEGPLFRVSLAVLGPDRHVLLLTLHHIVTDAWSLGVMEREIGALYRAYAARGESPLREPAIQYADFAAWQRGWLTGEVLKAQVRYWKGVLAGPPPLLELPLDRPRPEILSHRGAREELTVPAPVADALRRLGREEKATLFMVLLAAFKVLLRHRTGETDLLVGTDVANRNRLETEGLVGFFVNQLCLRTDLAGDPTFRELLHRVRETCLAAYAHQDLPFDRLVEGLKLERRLDLSPLFQIKLFLENTPRGGLGEGDLSVAPLDLDVTTAKIDLTLVARERADGAVTTFATFSTHLFEAETIKKFLRDYGMLLEAVASSADSRVTDLGGLLDRHERSQQTMQKRRRRDFDSTTLDGVQPRAVTLPQGDLVRMRPLEPGRTLPLLLEPAVEGVDPVEWARAHRREIDERLHEHGALLFRGFGEDLVHRFEEFAGAVCDGLFNENGEHPRESVSGNVYTPVSYPAEARLLAHNENSFNHRWPKKILFCCARPPERGGETPITDSREVYRRLDPALRSVFETRDVMYMRNYGGSGVGLPWQEVFRASDPAEVERRCREDSIELEWRDGDRLRTRAVRPAVIVHPDTGEKVWFNQAQHWHSSCLDPETRRSMRTLFAEEDLPRHCYFGDGSPIADEAMERILALYDELEVSFAWQRGDVLLVDNLLTAHGRNPFSGSRKILVAMGEITSYDQVSTGTGEGDR